MTMLNESAPPSDEEFDFAGSAREGMRKCEAEWTATGQRFAWIDQEPTWTSAGDWSGYLGDGFPRNPSKPC